MSTATRDWRRWTCACRLVVTDPHLVAHATEVADEVMDAVELAASRFRRDSEVSRLRPGWNEASPLLAELVAVSLDAARRTDGAVVPTLGAALAALGYDRSIEYVGRRPGTRRVLVDQVADWRAVRVEDGRVHVPAGVVLDLGATAKAWAADHVAADVAALGTGVLVSLGGDVATAGPAPAGGWQVVVHDLPGDVPQQVTLESGAALATSSTAHRVWAGGGGPAHHLLDPGTGAPVETPWRTATVVAGTCLLANTVSTGTLVKGLHGTGWLRRTRLPGRLVATTGAVTAVGGFPGGGGMSTPRRSPNPPPRRSVVRRDRNLS